MMNLFNILRKSCAGGTIPFEDVLPETTSMIVNILKIAIPIMVIIFGLIDLGKAVMAQKEDDIKKNQGLLIKRVIVAVFVFFVVAIVQFVVGIVGGSDSDNITSCINCFINNDCGN